MPDTQARTPAQGDRLDQILALLRDRRCEVADARKYGLVEREELFGRCEVAIRLQGGTAPERMTREELARVAGEAPSRRTIYKLINSGALRALRIGSKRVVTEAEVRHFETLAAEGHVDGYDVDRSRQK